MASVRGKARHCRVETGQRQWTLSTLHSSRAASIVLTLARGPKEEGKQGRSVSQRRNGKLKALQVSREKKITSQCEPHTMDFKKMIAAAKDSA